MSTQRRYHWHYAAAIPIVVAILYGAAHLPDMADRMDDQLGYAPVSEKWFRAIEVDLAESAISASDLRMMRSMFKRSMR